MTTLEVRPWADDLLGEGYQQRVIDLGEDPDGEGAVEAVLVRRTVRDGEQVTGAVLYVHGFSDYFFQTDLADFLAERGLAVYALDLRKSGRARKPGQTAHFVSDLATYDAELETALEIIDRGAPGPAGRGGGALHRRTDHPAVARPPAPRRPGRAGDGPGAEQPWFDLQGKPVMRGPVTWLLRGLSRVQPFRHLAAGDVAVYGDSLHRSANGEWEFDLDLKPLAGFPVTVGWLNAVRRGHARLHRGLDVGVPSLVLRSDKTHYSKTYSDATDRADTVLDVARSPAGRAASAARSSSVPIPDARHDVFLSLEEPRRAAYERLDGWLATHR